MEVFPNPATDLLTVSSPRNILKMRIYSLSGQILYETEVGKTDYHMNVANFSNGMYLIFAETDQGIKVGRVAIKGN
jgi:hypothetical protein